MIKTIPGILLCAVIGTVSWFASRAIPLGGVTISIILGILAGNILPLPSFFNKGIGFSEKKILTWAIALTGISLDYKILSDLGLPTLVLIISTVGLVVFAALLMGRKAGMDRDLCLLLGIGNAVCGSSAIAAAQGIIKTDDKNVGISVAAVNFLGTIGIFVIPALGSALLGMTDLQTGVLSGNALQAIGQVTAAGYSVSARAGEAAVVVKMCRILMLTPIVLILSATVGSSGKSGESGLKGKIPSVPSYIIIFIILSIAGTTGIIPEEIISLTKSAEKFLLMTAMAAIGMKISLKDLAAGGRQALMLGSAVWGVQVAFSALIILTLIGKV